MKLQLALDMHNINEALEILEKTVNSIDIIEIGTPLILAEGVRALIEIKKRFPKMELLFDAKIMDAGKYEADLAYDNGADIVTVLAASADSTIRAVVESARAHGKKVMADMIDVTNLKERAITVEMLGVDYICLHTAVDMHTADSSMLRYRELEDLYQIINVGKLAVAGGMNPESIREIMLFTPEIIIVGSYITKAENQKEALKNVRVILQ